MSLEADYGARRVRRWKTIAREAKRLRRLKRPRELAPTEHTKALLANGPRLFREIIHQIAVERSISPHAILGRSGFAKHVAARHEAYRRVSEAFPSRGTPWLGRLFDRDPSTIWYALNGGWQGRRARRKRRQCG